MYQRGTNTQVDNLATKKIDTFYAHYEICYPIPWSVNLPFLCVKCGNCCSLGSLLSAGKPLIGNPSEEQIKQMNQKIKPYLEEYNRIVSEDKSKCEDYLIKTKCPFLRPDNSCEIYAYRPIGCQAFPKTDCGMDIEEGLCESLDRFKRLRKALLKRQDYIGYYYPIIEDGIKPVKMTKKQYEKCVAKLLKAGMTPEELVLFKNLKSK